MGNKSGTSKVNINGICGIPFGMNNGRLAADWRESFTRSPPSFIKKCTHLETSLRI